MTEEVEKDLFRYAQLLWRLDHPYGLRLYSWIPDFPDSLMQRIKETLAWKNREQWVTRRVYGTEPEVYTSGTRSLCLVLTAAESVQLSRNTALPLKALQIKGAIFVPSTVEGLIRVARFDEISPPTGRVFEEHAVSVTEIDHQGFLIDKKQKAIRTEGALSLNAIHNEWAYIQLGRERGLLAPVPLGFGVFEGIEFNSAKIGLMLLGVYDRWNSRLIDFFSKVPYNNPFVPDENVLIAPHPVCAQRRGASADFFAKASPGPANQFIRALYQDTPQYATDLFRDYGSGIFRAHRQRVIFYSPHLENVLPVGEKLVLHDWEFAREISKESRQRQIGFFTLDIKNLFMQLYISIRCAQDTGLELLSHAARRSDLFAEFLRGYGLGPESAKRIGAQLYQQCETGQQHQNDVVQIELMSQIESLLF